MEEKITGILGYGGYIGSNATEKLLKRGYKVIGGQRKKVDKFDEYENFSYEYVDVKNAASLKGFIKKCDIVVNCVSPSHLFGKLVKDAVCRLDRIYIDPSDGSYEEDKTKTTGKCVAACGYIPGLSEYVPHIMAKTEFDKINRTIVYQGGFDGCSPGSFVDMILGAGNSGFYGDSYIKDSQIKPLTSDIKRLHETPFSEAQVVFKPLINSDNIKLQKTLDSDEFYFFCTYDDMSTLGFFMRLLVDVSKYDKEKAAVIIEEKLNERIKTNKKFGNQIVGAFLFMEIKGQKGGRQKAMTCKIFLTNVNRVCGNFLAEVITEAIERPEKIKEGYNYGFELVDDTYLQCVRQELGDDEYIKIEEISPEETISIEEITGQ